MIDCRWSKSQTIILLKRVRSLPCLVKEPLLARSWSVRQAWNRGMVIDELVIQHDHCFHGASEFCLPHRSVSGASAASQALASPSQRRHLLQELFADTALEIDDMARGKEDVISPGDDSHLGQLCFYDVLADYYIQAPESGKPILHMIEQLWSRLFASHIFSLLFHKY